MNEKFDPLRYKDTKFTIRRPTDGATIEDVYAKNLKTWVDGRGDLTELWSQGWEDREKLAAVQHVYYNLTDPGVLKGWHWHMNTRSQFVCPAGKMQIVLIDLREDKKTFGEVNQFICSSKNPMYVQIPPFVLKGWKALEQNAVIINLLSTADGKDNYKVPVETFVPEIWQPIFG